MTSIKRMLPAISLLSWSLVGCGQEAQKAEDGPCATVSPAFSVHVQQVLSDTTGRFFHDYPAPAPLPCELLQGLEEAMTDDSVRYHFEHLAQRYDDPRASSAFAFIRRHNDFHIAMALTSHWNPDVRIEGVKAVYNYRRVRPMVCATQSWYAQLEKQDRQAMRYFVQVLESTPWVINGSENATIHGVFIGQVLHTLDLFAGTDYCPVDPSRIAVEFTDQGIREALVKWNAIVLK